MKATLFLIVFLFTSVLFAAAPKKEQLIGSWLYVEENRSAKYTFYDDGTFSGSLTQHGKIVAMFKGTWSLDGDTLQYLYINSPVRLIAPDTRDHDKIIDIGNDYYIIQTRDGKRRLYSRIPETEKK